MEAHPGAMATLKSWRLTLGAVEAHSRGMEANPGVMESHSEAIGSPRGRPWALEAHFEAWGTHLTGLEALPEYLEPTP